MIMITLLARIAGTLEHTPADVVLKAVLDATEPKEKNIYVPDAEAVEKLYALYPGKCPITGRATGKCSKDKRKLETILKTWSVEDVEKAIKDYLEDCKQHEVMIKNFGTLLNNLPEVSKHQTTKEDSLWAQGYR